MLAVFDKSVAQCPEGLQSPNPESVFALKDGLLSQHFLSVYPNAVTINLGQSGFISYSNEKQNPFLPRLFAVVDDIFCLFQGTIENLAPLKQQYGLGKSGNEVNIIIEAYRSLRDRGPYPIEQVIRDIHGKFAFILYDCSSKNSFVAADPDGSVSFGELILKAILFCQMTWRLSRRDVANHLPHFQKVKDPTGLMQDERERAMTGGFFTSSGGLRSYEHPRHELKPVPRVDSSGEVCGANYKVDAETKKETFGMTRVGSAADWSSNY